MERDEASLLVIRVREEADGGRTVDAFVEAPLIYLDHWAVIELAKPSVLQDRFTAALHRAGTVAFSWINVLELGSVSRGDKTALTASST